MTSPLVGRVFNASKDVIESGLMFVVAHDECDRYHPTRRPWYLQVREYVDGECIGPWIPITRAEFREWNPNVAATSEQGNFDRIVERIAESGSNTEQSDLRGS